MNKKPQFLLLKLPEILRGGRKYFFLCHRENAGLINEIFFCFNSCGAVAQRGHGLLIREVSRSHNDSPQTAGLLWASDQLVAETTT
jgi:hypothetical protein